MNATKPRYHILDRRFKYTNAAQTDIRVTFEKVRRELIQQKIKAEDQRLKLVGQDNE